MKVTVIPVISLRVFGLLSSSLLLFPQRFCRYVLRPSSCVCRTREPSRNFELRPLLNPRGSPVLIPLWKRCGINNKDEDNRPKTLNDKTHQASSQKFSQRIPFIVGIRGTAFCKVCNWHILSPPAKRLCITSKYSTLSNFTINYIGLISLFNGISTFMGHLMPKPSLQKNNSETISPISKRIHKGGEVHIFPKGISPKVNQLVRLMFELTYFESAVKHFSHYATGTHPLHNRDFPYNCTVL